MSLVNMFGYTIALAVVGTSAAMMIMGERWQKVEQDAYASEKRPGWFIAISVLVLIFYAAALYNFVTEPKTVAGWLMMVIMPLGWTAKAALVTFNSKGRQVVSAIEGRDSWVKIGLARLPIAVIFAALGFFA